MDEYRARMEEFGHNMRTYVDATQGDHKVRQIEHERRQVEHGKRMEQHAIRMKEHGKRMEEHGIRMKEHDARMKKHDAMMKELKAALVSDKLIKSTDDDYTFKLDKTGLYVDDKKQSDALYQKYKKIIATATGDDIDMILKKEGSNFTINTNKSSNSKK